ncbi:hypothetical protein [Taibaiella helva]|uniref:hypothetical protein n=1 Tax=Taibaiella helva TaxID=2301235 RepID=UPI000E583911|nr:hypothetical protein [Taibaiella helva]
MKKTVLSLFVATAAFLPAQAQFLNSSFTDVQCPAPPGVVAHVSYLGAYSFGNLFYPDAQSDLYAYSWNQAGGIGWVRKENGNPANVLDQGTYSPIQYNGANAVDVAIVHDGALNENMLVVAYHNNNGHFLDFYIWNQFGITPYLTYPLSNMNIGSISIDAHEMNCFAVTWDGDGYIHTLAARTGGGLAIGCENLLDPQGIKYLEPDIAIGHGGTAYDGLTLHFVYMRSDYSQVVESTLPFEEIYSNCPPMVTPLIEDVLNTSSSTATFGYSRPRIDCPDHEPATDDWSYVINEYTPATYPYYPPTPDAQSRIITGRRAYSITPAVQHNVLNDGSLGNINMSFNVSGAPILPAVAYDPQGTTVNFAWNKTMEHPALGDNDFMGLRLRNDGAPASTDYWIIDRDPSIPQQSPIVTMSTQNDRTPELFFAFSGINPDPMNFYYTLYYKWAPWYNYGYRPAPDAPAGIAARQDEAWTVQAYPNPFTNELQLTVNAASRNQPLEVALSDINARLLHQYKGTAEEINRQLAHTAATLQGHLFFLKVTQTATGQSKTLKVSRR